MSLDTVLKIGKAFRASENGLKRFKYIKECPIDTEKTSVLRLSLPIKEDYSFDFDNIHEILNENVIGSNTLDTKLYYLTFKTSDSDGMVKYIFGDIFYSQSAAIDKNGKIETGEGGYYRLDNPDASLKAFRANSFERGEDDYIKISELIKSKNQHFEDNPLIRFRKSFYQNIEFIHNILKYQIGIKKFIATEASIPFKVLLLDEEKLKFYTAWGIFDSVNASKTSKKIFSQLLGADIEEYNWEILKDNSNFIEKLAKYCNSNVFLHFHFPEKNYWYNFSQEFDFISQKMLDDFVDKSKHIDGYVLKKTLYKTLCSGDTKNDIQFPNFNVNAKHKAKAFTIEEISDLFYAIDYSKKATISPTEDVKLIILPYGENLTAKDYENFSKTSDLLVAETVANRNNTENDLLFSWFDDENDQKNLIAHFDMIFSKKGGLTSPDTDLIELSGIKKSSLQEIKKRIKDIQREIYNKRQQELRVNSELKPLSIIWSFNNILGSGQTDKNGRVLFKPNAKFQSHLLKVLPQIYTASFVSDPFLLPAMIEKTEYSIRQGDPKFAFLKYDFEFLISIQNTPVHKQNFNKIMSSKSYELGKNLGRLALFLKPDKNGDSPINSFEKEFVGNLSRHIGQLRDVQKFCSYLFEKYALHKEKANFIPFDVKNGTITKNIEDILLVIMDSANQVSYDKNECAFGFFTSYFGPYETSKKEESTKTEIQEI